jgi:uncharacterized protein (DUF4415 family)
MRVLVTRIYQQRRPNAVWAPQRVDPPVEPAGDDASRCVTRHFYRPWKEAISLRLDADVLEWPRHRNERYQTEINIPLPARGWLGREDSNLRMAESKSAALPLGYAPSRHAHKAAGAAS